MSFLKFVLAAVLIATPSLATPLRHRAAGDSSTPALTVNTPIGAAHGVADGSNAVRFAVKYANAQRWQDSAVASSWTLPNGNTDPSVLPLPCIQDGFDDSAMSEDCLSMILYVPQSLQANSSAPTMLWIHGGSFTSGSATGPGLDGSNLAAATDSIVAVMQYRLGVLGFFPPSGKTNLAVTDTINALKFLQKVVPSFGGDASQITLAGQSAGATMIRSLLAAPSASSLFKSAILQSDTLDYGFLSSATQSTLQSYFDSQLPCSTTDSSCLNGLSVDQILSAQDDLVGAAPGLDPSSTQAMPIHPVHDGSLITSTLDSSTPFPSVNKPLLISTVHQEAGYTIYWSAPSAMAPSDYSAYINWVFGTSVANQLLADPSYSIPASDAGNPNADARPQLQQMGTDQVWRCPAWTLARSWTQNGGTVYAGEYVVGASYPGNSAIPFCTEPGVVCHQDDIEIVFGTVPNPSTAQAALIEEMQARYNAFLHSGNPNAAGYASWTPSTTSDVHALLLGGFGEVPVGACDPSFWGAAIPYDYQIYNI